MHRLVPQFILENFSGGQSNGRFPCTAIFVDISGFTAVTEAFMQQGKIGAEILADTMLAIFEPQVTVVYGQGGFITGFAGDAFTAVFSGDDQKIAAQRALGAAWQIRDQMVSFAQYSTALGTFSFDVKIGMAAGEVDWGILQGESGAHTYFFRGSVVDICARAEHLAAPGELILDSAVLSLLAEVLADGRLAVERVVSDFVRATAVSKLPPPVEIMPTETLPGMEAFFPADLLHMQLRGEFRQVITLFMNAGSAPQSADLTHLMETVFRLQARYGGYLCRLDFGDKGCNLLFFWGAPSAYENDIERALNFILALQAETAVPLRAGVTYRLVFAGFAGSELREEYTCYGLSVNLAARLMMQAEWGGVWLDRETAVRAAEQFQTRLVGRLPFKGFSQNQPVFALEGRLEQVEPFYQGRLVGRETEQKMLSGRIAPIFEGQFGGVTAVTGDAGIGKSRLVVDFSVHLAAPPQTISQTAFPNPLFFICQSDEIMRQPLNPFRYLLRRVFDQAYERTEDENKAAFNQYLDQLLDFLNESELRAELERTRVFLGSLVDLYWPDSLYDQLEPELRFENALIALKSFLLAESARQPLIILLEDAHWLDSDSLIFLRRLTRNVSDYPFALILTSRRPDVAPGLELETSLHTIHLAELSALNVGRLAEAFLQGELSPELAQGLAERAEGNPFFVEQILLFLREEGLLIETAAGFVTENVAEHLPIDIQAVLIARLDRLSQAVKEVVQTAAVLGREFEVQILSQILHSDLALNYKIEAAEREAIWSALSELRYLFRHALLRDAAYGMQLQRRLGRLHQLAAEAIEEVYREDLSPHYPDLAYHFNRAGNTVQEFKYARLAADRAEARYLNREALNYLERALALLPDGQLETQFELLEQRERLHGVAGDRSAQRADLLALQAVATLITDPDLRAELEIKILLRDARLADLTSEYDHAIDRAKTAVSRAENAGYFHQQTDAIVSWSISLWHLGRYDEARPLLLKAVEQAKQGAFYDLEADSLNTLGLICMYQSYYEDAAGYFQGALRGYRDIGNRRGEALVINSLGILAREVGDQPEMRARFEQALLIFREIGHRWGESGMLNNLGLIQYDLGAYSAAVGHFSEALERCREIDNRQMVALTLSNLGLSNFHLGLFETAEMYFAEALAVAEKIGDRQVTALALENWATLALEVEDYELAQKYAQRGLQITRDIGKRDSECSAATILGRALTASDQYDAADELLVSAMELSKAIGVDYLGIEARVGLVMLNLARGQQRDALMYAQQVLAFLLESGTDSMDDPLDAYAVCLDALTTGGDLQTTAVSVEAYTFLQDRAGRIEDAAFRQTFLQNLSSHRRILQYYRQFQAE